VTSRFDEKPVRWIFSIVKRTSLPNQVGSTFLISYFLFLIPYSLFLFSFSGRTNPGAFAKALPRPDGFLLPANPGRRSFLTCPGLKSLSPSGSLSCAHYAQNKF
jgi:hypothetical protein